MEKFTRDELKEFRVDFADAVKDLEKKYNVKLDLQNITYDSFSFRAKLDVTRGNSETEEKELFEAVCDMFGFKPDDYLRRAYYKGTYYTLFGFDPSKPKNVCKVRLDNGNTAGCSIETFRATMI